MVNVFENNDPVTGLRFTVDLTVPALLNGGPANPIQFSRVSGLESNSEVIEYREGNDPFTVRKIPGLVTYPAVVLEKGMAKDNSLVIWRSTVASFIDTLSGSASSSVGIDPTGVAGDFLGVVTILAYDANGDVTRGWQLVDAWPSSLKYSDLDAASNEILIESVELQHSGLITLGTGGVDQIG